MSLNSKSSAINQINEAFMSYNKTMQDYKNHHGISIAAWQMETVPPELTSSFNILSLKVPSFLKGDDQIKEYWSGTADVYIAPEISCSCTGKAPSIPVYNFKLPAGYGEDAAVSIHNETANLLHSLFHADLKKINIDTLKEKTGIYENLRKTVRGICSLRNSSPSLLAQSELAMIFETALTFPPEIALKHISPFLNIFSENPISEKTAPSRAMIFSCDPFNGETADLIEKEEIPLLLIVIVGQSG